MNKIYQYIMIGAVAVGLSSCDNDWLDLEPSDSVITNVKTLSDVEFTLNGIYSTMQSSDAYSGRLVYYGDVTGDDMQAVSSTKRTANAYLYGFTKSNAPASYWRIPYEIIQNCNVILKNIDNIPVGDDEKDKLNDYKGQALALRGMTLFDLTKLYGYPYTKDNGASMGACIVTDVLEKDAMPQRSTVAQCYDQILKDLKESTTLLGKKFNKGKLNRWAALTLLSRAYLYHGDNDKALDAAKQAIEGAEDNGYALWTNEEYPTAWANDASKQKPGEVLFEIINLTTDSPGKESLGYLYNPSGYADGCVTVSFYNYLSKDKDDVRLKIINVATKDKYSSSSVYGRAFVNKYQPQQGENVMDANIPLIRLSEAYLNAAEAAAKLTAAGNDHNAEAAEYLHAIVNRANPAKSVDAATTVSVDKVLDERRKELVGEGHRMFDLLRNGKAVERVKASNKALSKTKHTCSDEFMTIGLDNYKIVLPIPLAERNVSHLPNNPGYGE